MGMGKIELVKVKARVNLDTEKWGREIGKGNKNKRRQFHYNSHKTIKSYVCLSLPPQNEFVLLQAT
ncbi:site-specific tyrosine recombinase XerD [Sesbania bispinosa]|nr:site-specific tyrosine recombinase XerD [Sesbania bispinosa]